MGRGECVYSWLALKFCPPSAQYRASHWLLVHSKFINIKKTLRVQIAPNSTCWFFSPPAMRPTKCGVDRMNFLWKILITWSPAVHSVVCRQARGSPGLQTPQGCHLLKRSPPEIGKILVGSDGFGRWAEGTQAWSHPAPELLLCLVACIGRLLQAYGNTWRGKKRTNI